MKIMTQINYRKAWVGLVISGVLSTACVSAFAQGVVRPVGPGEWYYAIGGGDPLMYYNQSNKTTLSLGVSAEWNLLRGCSFDPSFSIADTFGDMKHNVYGLAEDVMSSAISTFSAWGLSKVQENWPGLYDTLTKGLKDAKESYTISLKTCRDAQADVRAGRNPVDGWYSISRKSSWDKAAASGENPVESEKKIEENLGNDGVAWVNGEKAGGRNPDGTLQPAIRTTGDTIGVGYDHAVASAGGSDNDVTGTSDAARVFPNREAAIKWMTDVVGEREVRTCTSCGSLRTTVGQGLRYQYVQERSKTDADIASALNATPLTLEHLEDLSVPSMGVVINHATIRSLRQAPADERVILANKLAGEIALARVIEKALMARDLLDMGAQEPNISAAGEVAHTQINYSRQRLQSEIDNILYESEVRSKVTSTAAQTIARRGQARDLSAGSINYVEALIKQPQMRDGAIVNDE